MRHLLLWVPVILILSAPATATPILYDNGAPTGDLGWSVSQGYLLADDFLFPVDTVLTGISGWDGDAWMILEGELEPNELLASGLVGEAMPALRLEGGTRYWLGVLNGSLDDPCSNSASAWLTERNSTIAAHYLSYPFGPMSPGIPLCEAGAPFPPYDFSAVYWSDGDFPTGGVDFAFQVHGNTVPEPSLLLLFGASLTGVVIRRRCSLMGRPPSSDPSSRMKS